MTRLFKANTNDAHRIAVGSRTPAGLMTYFSAYSLEETVSRIVTALTAQGMGLLGQINHAAAAAEKGFALRPTVLLLFGFPAGALMHAAQTSAIDLPLKALVWEDESGQIWLSYNDPIYIAARHHMDLHATPNGAAALAAAAAALAEIAHEINGSESQKQPVTN